MSISDIGFWICVFLLALVFWFLPGCATSNTPGTICVDSCKLDQVISDYVKLQQENAELQAWRDKMFF
jgi:hypothetical protein